MRRFAKGRSRPVPGTMNKNEAAYAAVLDQKQRAGEIRGFWFEPVVLRLAKLTTYRPDFMVFMPDDTIEFHEVKGRSGKKYWCEEDAKVKIKVAAEQYGMFRFIITWLSKTDGWVSEEF